MSNARALRRDEKGNLYVWAEEIDDGRGKQGPGIGVLAADGATKAILFGQGAPQRAFSAGEPPRSILSRAGRYLWLDAGMAGLIRRIDLTSCQIVEQLPAISPAELRAIDDQGHLFVGRGNSALAPISVLQTKR